MNLRDEHVWLTAEDLPSIKKQTVNKVKISKIFVGNSNIMLGNIFFLGEEYW